MKVALTARAWRTPLGNTLDGALARLLAGERAAQENPHFDASSYRCRLAAVIPGEPERPRHLRHLGRTGLFAAEAAREALRAMPVSPGPRLGVFAGYGGLRADWDELIPALAGQTAALDRTWERGFKRLHPFWMLRHLSNNVHALLAIELGATGDGTTCGGPCAGASALSQAAAALEAGALDVALVVAYDTYLMPESLVEQAERGAATDASLAALSAPYDQRASGRVPGEAAVALVLERCADAGARALAWVEVAEGSDGCEGEPSAAALAAVARRVWRPGSFIDGASRASVTEDDAERAALDGLVGAGTLLTSTAAAFGAAGSAAAPLQLIALAELLRRRVIGPIAGLTAPRPGPLSPVGRACATDARSAVGLSSGAPGLAAAVRVELP